MEIKKANGLQEYEGMVREVEVVLNLHLGDDKPGYYFPGLTGKDEKQARIRLAYAQYNGPKGRIQWSTWDDSPFHNAAIEVMTAPTTTEYTSHLDMAVTAAFDDPGTGVFIGEVRTDGRFVPLNYPLRVGRKVADMEGPIYVPAPSAKKVALAARRSDVIGVGDVHELVAKLGTSEGVSPEAASRPSEGIYDPDDDLSYLIGQAEAKEALEIAMAGGHHLLLVGPPGEGKSELAKRAYTICPPLTVAEAVEVSAMWEGRGEDEEIRWARPFVKATKQTTPTGLHGGGSTITGPKPGLVSLAHRGILMADELFLWTRKRLDSLRMPLEDKEVSINRRDWSVTFPADFQLVATANPCPCGFWSPPEYDDERECRCTEREKRTYVNKISGPILDRIDIQAWVPRLGERVLSGEEAESSAGVRDRVTRARERQAERYGGEPITYNNELNPAFYHLCGESEGAIDTLERLGEVRVMSTRRIARIRRVARTIADLRGSEAVERKDIERATEFMEVSLPRR